MNRQQKRLLQRQGQVDAEGAPVARRSEPNRRQPPPGARGAGTGAPRTRTRPRDFLHEVNVEMRKVAWPTRAETLNYSSVVLVTLIVLIALIFGLDYAFQKGAIFLFK